MNYFLLVLMLSFVSCTKYAAVTKGNMGINISPVQMDLSYLSEIPWNVGMKREEKITQSFTFTADLPKVEKEDLDFLIESKNIDAWIIRLIVKRNSEVQDLGSLYVKFRPKHSTTATRVSLKVYYAAAFASERFRSFKCPAFGHDKRIKKMSLEGSNDQFEITLGSSSYYGEKPQLIELTPSAFNGGNTLRGEYWLEIAPYDSANKMIHAPFKRIPRHVVVSSEETISVRSCDGIKMEND